MNLIFASQNEHKKKEVEEIFHLFSFHVHLETCTRYLPKNFSFDDVESFASYEQNSKIKAKTIYQISKKLTLSDDSGLEVDALKSNPGVESARFEKSLLDGETQDQANRRKLREELKALGLEESKARFRCVLTLFLDHNLYLQSEGVLEGKVITKEQGENGFGYDPLFIPTSTHKTLSELSAKEKNKISHRTKAIQNLIQFIKK